MKARIYQPKLTFKDLDNIEWAMENMNGILESHTARKQNQFRRTYLKIYMALRRAKPKTMPRVRKNAKRPRSRKN